MEAMEQLLHFITGFGWIAVLLVIFSESGLMVGFFMPGDSLLFTSGFLVHQNILGINIHLFVLLLFIAAVLGNTTGYLIGKKVGRKLFKPNSRIFKTRYLHEAERFYEQYGSKTIILAMFVPIVRAFAPVAAGIAGMEYRRFLTFNIIGAALWVGILTYLGYFAGAGLIQAGLNIEAVVLLIIALSLLPAVIHAFSNPQRRKQILRRLKRSRP
jgi:membrane-associated protein